MEGPAHADPIRDRARQGHRASLLRHPARQQAGGRLLLRLLRAAALRLELEISFGDRLAQLLPAVGRGERHHPRGSQLRDAADRNPLCPVRRVPRSRLLGWPAANRAALLTQFRFTALHSRSRARLPRRSRRPITGQRGTIFGSCPTPPAGSLCICRFARARCPEDPSTSSPREYGCTLRSTPRVTTPWETAARRSTRWSIARLSLVTRCLRSPTWRICTARSSSITRREPAVSFQSPASNSGEDSVRPIPVPFRDGSFCWPGTGGATKASAASSPPAAVPASNRVRIHCAVSMRFRAACFT